ncbi:response regulator transcription factor [Catenulispora sp. GAS73]|uniref:response regulator transcription factor n=1 Tax=Catenulispora sp. GAS73 TaxID=3156269 RepID=UPI0035116852
MAIVDPLPVYRHGIGAILSAAGHTVEAPNDALVWADNRRDCLLLLSLCTEHDWGLLAQLSTSVVGRFLIALVDDDSGLLGARAMRNGAHSVLPRDVSIRSLERAVAATIDGDAVMPAEVARVLADSVRPASAQSEPALSAEQLSWLRLLAGGSTVARVAREAGYSERAMFRLLQTLYRKLGAESRIEAVLRAQELGWLSGAPEAANQKPAPQTIAARTGRSKSAR